MARIRYLKPGFFDNEDLCTLKPVARLLFAGLWCYADREGRLEDRPARLKKDILGYDRCDADALLGVLAERQFIIRYEGCEGQHLIQIQNWHKHQRPHVKEPPSTYPAPEGYVSAPIQHLPDPPLTGNGERGTGNGDGERSPNDPPVVPPVGGRRRRGQIDPAKLAPRLRQHYEELKEQGA